jgi:hypothetical protein
MSAKRLSPPQLASVRINSPHKGGIRVTRNHHRIKGNVGLALTLAGTAAAAPAAEARLGPAPSASVPTQSRPPTTIIHTAATESGFDWGEAGIGAGSAFAVTIIAVGGGLAATRRSAGRRSAVIT